MNSKAHRPGDGRGRRLKSILGSWRGVGIDVRRAGQPTPTQALPASEAKVIELEARAAAGLALFHPDDAKHGLD